MPVIPVFSLQHPLHHKRAYQPHFGTLCKAESVKETPNITVKGEGPIPTEAINSLLQDWLKTLPYQSQTVKRLLESLHIEWAENINGNPSTKGNANDEKIRLNPLAQSYELIATLLHEGYHFLTYSLLGACPSEPYTKLLQNTFYKLLSQGHGNEFTPLKDTAILSTLNKKQRQLFAQLMQEIFKKVRLSANTDALWSPISQDNFEESHTLMELGQSVTSNKTVWTEAINAIYTTYCKTLWYQEYGAGKALRNKEIPLPTEKELQKLLTQKVIVGHTASFDIDINNLDYETAQQYMFYLYSSEEITARKQICTLFIQNSKKLERLAKIHQEKNLLISLNEMLKDAKQLNKEFLKTSQLKKGLPLPQTTLSVLLKLYDGMTERYQRFIKSASPILEYLATPSQEQKKLRSTYKEAPVVLTLFDALDRINAKTTQKDT